jgi:putative DNA primase/helicase
MPRRPISEADPTGTTHDRLARARHSRAHRLAYKRPRTSARQVPHRHALGTSRAKSHAIENAMRKSRPPRSQKASPKNQGHREDDRPTIAIKAGRRPWMVDRAEKVILDYQRWKIFQRGGILCRVVEIDGSNEDRKSIRRPDGAVVLNTVDSVMLEEIFSRAIAWHRRNQKGELVPADCPPKVASFYLSRSGQWRLPVLTGVIEAPTILANGKLVVSPAYDPASRLFFYSRENWLPVPENPTRADAEAALKILREPFKEFPFVSEADRSVILSEILTGAVRRQLFSAPLHGHDAPAQGSGKSLAADCVSLILTGRPVASMPLGGDTEEVRKRITSTLLSGDLIVNIDNVVRPLRSDALAMVLTQSIYADRILGRNERTRLPTNVLWLATGNNLTFAGDLTTRAIVCRIDAKIERPEARSFSIGDLRGHVRNERVKLMRAALTILRAYHVAGSPKQRIEKFGRFEEWSDWIRSALIWLGCADPCRTRERITMNDPDRTAIASVFGAWHTLFRDRMMLLREIISSLEPTTNDPETQAVRDARTELREALLNIAASANNPQRVDTKRLAGWCRENIDRVAGGLRLTRGDVEKHKTATWRVVVAREGGQTGYTGHNSVDQNRMAIPTLKTSEHRISPRGKVTRLSRANPLHEEERSTRLRLFDREVNWDAVPDLPRRRFR